MITLSLSRSKSEPVARAIFWEIENTLLVQTRSSKACDGNFSFFHYCRRRAGSVNLLRKELLRDCSMFEGDGRCFPASKPIITWGIFE